MAAPKKKTSLSLGTKLKLLSEVDAETMTKTHLAKKYGVAKSTVSVLLRNRKKIEQASSSSSYQPSRKRMRSGKTDKVDEALFAWCKQAQSTNTHISGALLKKAADQLAAEMKIDFSASSGWLSRFKKRKGISFRTSCGDGGPEDQSQTDEQQSNTHFLEYLKVLNDLNPEDQFADECPRNILSKVLEDYSPEDIFNASETGIFYKCLPDKTMMLKGELCSSGEKAKERLTALVAANMTGSEKLPLLIVGKISKPQCFKNVKSLPLVYMADRKAWITSTIFENWIRKLDRKFHARGRQIVMFVDKCPAHQEIANLNAIKLVFLTPNTTNKLQPCDQGIIQTLKLYYRRQVLQKYLFHLKNANSPQDVEKFKVSTLEALYMLRTAWGNISETVVANCFRLGGFKSHACTTTEQEDSQLRVNLQNEIEKEIQNLFDNLNDIIPLENTAQIFCAIDKDVVACEEVSGLASHFIEQTDTDSEEEEVYETPDKTVSGAQAREAFQVLKKFAQQQDNGEELIDIICQFDVKLYSRLLKLTHLKQMKITDFFQ